MKLDLYAIKERLEETSFKEAYVKGDAWKGYEVKDENNGMVLAEVSCGTDAEFFANARQDIPALVAEIEKLRDGIERLLYDMSNEDYTDPNVVEAIIDELRMVYLKKEELND